MFTCLYNFKKNAYCAATYSLKGGTLVGAGSLDFSAPKFEIAITGGTGKFRSATGDVEASPVGRTTPSRSRSPSLQHQRVRPHIELSAANRTAMVVLLVDVSGSMQAQDVKPNRLTAVVTAMHEFLNVIPAADKVGLVTFSDKVEVIAAPTTDHAAVSTDLDVLAPQGGTALGNGVDTAVNLIVSSLAASGIHRQPGQFLPGAIVLESDGAQTRGRVSPFQAAQLARATGVRIYGVALGKRHAFITQGSGYFELKIPVPPDPGTVGILVRTSGGVAYAARNATKLENVYRQIGLTIGTRPQRTDITSWFELAAAILLVLAVIAARLRGAPLP